MLTGKIYDIQGFTVQDGPGIRTTVFLKGCPLRCPWCHSPESISFESQLNWMKMRCIGTEVCGACLTCCPNEAISLGDVETSPLDEVEYHIPKIDLNLCTNCGTCAVECPCEALYICGTDYTVDEVLERVKKDTPFFQNSGGGVTVSGGEPMAQHQFTSALFKGMKGLGIHTALDTTAYTKIEYLQEVLPHVDLFLFDIKHMDSKKHKAVVGVENDLILKNISTAAKAGAQIQVRVPVIPNFNDSVQNFESLRDYCLSLGEALVGVQLLPYHNLGIVKNERLFITEGVMEAPKMTDERALELATILVKAGISIKLH
jgi:pyruvate formate lyase activating enzyme